MPAALTDYWPPPSQRVEKFVEVRLCMMPFSPSRIRSRSECSQCLCLIHSRSCSMQQLDRGLCSVPATHGQLSISRAGICFSKHRCWTHCQKEGAKVPLSAEFAPQHRCGRGVLPQSSLPKSVLGKVFLFTRATTGQPGRKWQRVKMRHRSLYLQPLASDKCQQTG